MGIVLDFIQPKYQVGQYVKARRPLTRNGISFKKGQILLITDRSHCSVYCVCNPNRPNQVLCNCTEEDFIECNVK